MALVDELADEYTQNWVPDEKDDEMVLDDTYNYLKLLKNQTGLKLLQEAKIRKAFDEAGPHGLFCLFIMDSLLRNVSIL